MEQNATLRVKDWGVHYENNRTREYKHLEWVPIPNKLDGDGELIDHAGDARQGTAAQSARNYLA